MKRTCYRSCRQNCVKRDENWTSSEKRTKRCDFSQLFAKTNFAARKRKEDGRRQNYSVSELNYSNYKGRSANNGFVCSPTLCYLASRLFKSCEDNAPYKRFYLINFIHKNLPVLNIFTCFLAIGAYAFSQFIVLQNIDHDRCLESLK